MPTDSEMPSPTPRSTNPQPTGDVDFDSGLVGVDWLVEHLENPDLVLLDCTVYLRQLTDDDGEPTVGYRSESGLADFERGHLPTARFADLTGDLCDNSGPLRYAIPAPEQFCAAMGALGVGDASRVVLYDQNMSMWAARVWWMLRWVGFDRAALLDGGQRAWLDSGRPLSVEVRPAVPRTLTPQVRPGLIADRHEVTDAIGDGSTCLIDALGEAQYRGEQNNYGRPGHIPGAVNTPATGLLERATGRYRPLDELASHFTADPGQRVITYCGGGIAASSDAFVLTRLGYRDVAVYTASLQEWATDQSNPLVVS